MTSSAPVATAGRRRVALKVDCDTFLGTRAGLPNLLRALAKRRLRATFFFTLGPDRSGRAIVRIFTRRGFLRKMIRSRALSLYGPRTALYGTLLPAPMIGRRLASLIRSVGDAGHEVGVHGWDHVRWHDRLDRMSDAQIRADYGRAHDVFARIFGRRAHASAAPGWHATPRSLAVQESFGLRYASDTRGGTPFFPEANGRRFRTIQLPTTLPTWDEMYNSPDVPNDDALIARYRAAIAGTEVHSMHTEGEGTVLFPLFERQLDAWLADGVTFVTLDEIAGEALAAPERVPVRRIVRGVLPGRAGEITASAPA
ncbi:MAG TPA: polysaccharide deacetylase family protein [Gemmatimonadaceae bacterium]|nr:polysaccharide deacetylase family protein [Gemmatimonadaceae bacterium]